MLIPLIDDYLLFREMLAILIHAKKSKAAYKFLKVRLLNV